MDYGKKNVGGKDKRRKKGNLEFSLKKKL
jgi:hypothetical protein